MVFFDKLKRNDEWKQRSDVKQEFINTDEEVKYPVTVFENRNISANPPYIVLKFAEGYCIQIIDFLSRQFFDSDTVQGEGYSIALFKITDEEVEWAKNSNKDALDKLANALYNSIPADRFLKASVVVNNEQKDINVAPKCQSLNGEQLSELQVLQRICCKMEKENKEENKDEISKIKKRIGALLIEQDEIWVAHDMDFSVRYPYVGLMGRLEIFTKEEYAVKAKEHFESVSEGHISIVKVENKNMNAFFDSVLHLGFFLFNLDNGFFPIEMNITDFHEYKEQNVLERDNRVMRACFLRNLQGVHRFSKITDDERKKQVEQIYKNVLNTVMSTGYTALCNGVLYALAAGGQNADGVTLYTKKTIEKLKKGVGENERMLLAPGDTRYGVIEGSPGYAVINIPEKGNFLCVFTDKTCAEVVRAEFSKKSESSNNNIIAITFEELISHGIQCDGIVIDLPSYAQLVPKAVIEDMKNQMEKQKKGE